MFPKKSYLRVTNIRQSRPAQILLTNCVSCLNSGLFLMQRYGCYSKLQYNYIILLSIISFEPLLAYGSKNILLTYFTIWYARLSMVMIESSIKYKWANCGISGYLFTVDVG